MLCNEVVEVKVLRHGTIATLNVCHSVSCLKMSVLMIQKKFQHFNQVSIPQYLVGARNATYVWFALFPHLCPSLILVTSKGLDKKTILATTLKRSLRFCLAEGVLKMLGS